MSIFKNVAVIGTGVIGTGWVIRCLAHGKKVSAYDINLKHKNNLIKEIKRTWPFVKKMFSKKKINFNNLSFHTNLNEALKNAEFIFECAPENYYVKTNLIKKIGLYSKPNSIISSSSSGLLPSKIYSKCKYPERGLIGHPFNPVYLLPGVEIVPGKKTKKLYLNKAKKFYETISIKLSPEAASNLVSGDIINVALVLQSNVNGDGKKFTKTFSQAAFDKNGQKVTTITIQLKGFQGRILSEKITIEKDTGSSNTGLPMP